MSMANFFGIDVIFDTYIREGVGDHYRVRLQIATAIDFRIAKCDYAGGHGDIGGMMRCRGWRRLRRHDFLGWGWCRCGGGGGGKGGKSGRVVDDNWLLLRLGG